MRNRLVLGLLLLLFLVGAFWLARGTAPETRLHTGRAALQQGDFDQAGAQAALLENEDHFDHALLLRGEAALLQRDPARALDLLNRLQDRGELQLQAIPLVGRAHLALGNVREAQRTFAYLLTRRPDDLDGLRGLAAAAFDLGAWPQAVDHCRQWAALDPRDGRPERLIGLMNKDLGRYPQAIEAYSTALGKNLTQEVRQEVREELAECRLKQKEYREAYAALEGSPPEYRSRARFLVLWGDCQRGLGEGEEARRAAAAALAAAPADPAALRLQGRLLLEADRPEEALPFLEKAAAIPPKEFENHHLLGLAYARLGQTEAAKKHQREVDAIQGTMDALTKLTEALLRTPGDSAIHLELAEQYDRMEMRDLAAKHRRLAADTKR